MSIERLSNGRFKKGVSGNPGGRPKIKPEIMEAIRGACPDALNELIKYVHHHNPKIAMWAITELLDRGYGKPCQAVQMDVTANMDVRSQVRSVLLERKDDQQLTMDFDGVEAEPEQEAEDDNA